MRYGFYLPTRGPTATRDGILSLARTGERLGLHSAMIADHIVFPTDSESTYPYTVDGKQVDLLPRGASEVARCEPVYETFAGWKESTVGIKEWDKLPANARAYL